MAARKAAPAKKKPAPKPATPKPAVDGRWSNRFAFTEALRAEGLAAFDSNVQQYALDLADRIDSGAFPPQKGA